MDEDIEKQLIKYIYSPKYGSSNLNEFIKKASEIDGLRGQYESTKEMITNLTDFYNSQQTNQIFKPVRMVYDHITANYFNECVQMDLADVSNESKLNNNYNWLLVFIDVYTRFATVYLLKNKSSSEVNDKFELFIKENAKNPIKNLTSDNGSEFIAKSFLKIAEDNKIKMYFGRPNEKNQTAIVERFIRTLRSRIDKYKANFNTKIWYHVLPDLVYNYNNATHRTIKGTPVDMVKKDDTPAEIEQKEYKNTFSVGDSVRYLKKKSLFEKGEKQYTKSIHKINKIDGNRIWLEWDGQHDYFLPRELLLVNDSFDIDNFGLTRKVAPNDKEDILKKARLVERDKLTVEDEKKISNEGIALNKSKRVRKEPKKYNLLGSFTK